MRNAIISLLFLVLVVSNGFSQQSSDYLKREKQKLEKKIANTKNLLQKVKNNSEASLNELRLLENQIKSREALVRVFDNQVRVAEVKMIEKKQEVSRLTKRLEDLKIRYKAMVLYAYKHRNNFGKIMFILSANNYHDAIKRNKYLKKVAQIQKKQLALIKQNQQLIKTEIKNIGIEKENKLLALEEKKQERDQIEKDKGSKEKTYRKFKKEEEKLYAQLQEDEKNKQALKQKIDAAIKSEVAAESKRQKDLEDKKKLAAANKKKNTAAKTTTSKTDSKGTAKTGTGSKTTTTAKDPFADEQSTTSTTNFEENDSDEGKAIGKSFESKKGALAWPVSGGTITERFGRNAHPTLKDVYTNNNGIDITCGKGASVRAVFEGEVTSVFSITGAGWVVIVKHGPYRTVYSNLADKSVRIGSKVSAKQNIGSLLVSDGVSVCHFEVHFVSSAGIQTLNPSLWLGR